MDRVKKHFVFLRYISSVSSCAHRRHLLEAASASEITALSEIAFNILGGVFSLTESELSALQRHKKVLRTLAAKHFRVSEKREAIVTKSIAVRHLLTVFFRHYLHSKHERERSTETDSDSTDSVPAAYSESDTTGEISDD